MDGLQSVYRPPIESRPMEHPKASSPRTVHSRSSYEQSVVRSARELLFEHAFALVDGQLAGALAAIPQPKGDQKTVVHDLNYTEIFIRDNVPVMIYLLIEGQWELVRHFLNTCLKLQSIHHQTAGIFPTSFCEIDGRIVSDYGQRAIGRVTSVDTTLWWPILAHTYVRRSGDLEWARQHRVQLGIQRLLHLLLKPNFRDAPTLLVPDGAFMIDRPLDVWGTPLEIQVLLYGALLCSAELIRLGLEAPGGTDSSNQGEHHERTFLAEQHLLFSQAVDWAHRLRHNLLKHYWMNTSSIQVLRRRPTEQYGEAVANEYNIQTESIPHWLQYWLGTDGGYLIGNIRTGRPDFRFFTLGNCLGAMFDIISPAQQLSLFRLVVHNQAQLVAEMPMRICHPPLDSEKWRSVTGFDPKNRPWCYHNGGHWPCLLWFLVAAVVRTRHAGTNTRLAPVEHLLEQAYQGLLNRLPKQKWAEYFDGPTGLWTGQQARYYQTWTLVGFLLVHHLLKVDPADAHILDLPRLDRLKTVPARFREST